MAAPTTTGTATRSASTTTHPDYQLWAPVWRKLAHCYEGSGGFLDGTYLVAHPREWDDYKASIPKKPSKKLLARRKIARYENVAQTILDQVKAALFRGSVVRTIGKDDKTTENHPLRLWWDDVDGCGTAIDDYMAQRWVWAGICGHVVHLMDLPAMREGEAPLTQADAGEPFLRTYTALDLADWLIDDYGTVTAVKLLEVEPRPDIKTSAVTDAPRIRYVTDTDWELVSSLGKTVNQGAHGFGRLPVVIQYAKRRALSTVLGQSVLNDPNLYIDLYNLTSELRELLRNQTFSILNIVLGTGETAIDLERAKELAGDTTGTENVLFSAAASQFITADASNVAAYQDERDKLLRVIYRLAGVPWESDSKDAEALGSLKLKREDMNQVLAGYADECEKAEYAFVELWYRAKYGVDGWEQQLESDEVTVRYPDTFDVTPFAEILEQAQAAIAIDMPPAFMKELRSRLVAKFLPDATPTVLATIDKELEQMAKEPPQTAMQRAADLALKLKQTAPPQGTTQNAAPKAVGEAA